MSFRRKKWTGVAIRQHTCGPMQIFFQLHIHTKTQPKSNPTSNSFHAHSRSNWEIPVIACTDEHAVAKRNEKGGGGNRRACLVGELGIQGLVIVQRVDLGTEAANCGIERLGSLAKRLLFGRVSGDEGRSRVLQLLGTLQSFAHFNLQGLQNSRRRRRRAALLGIISHPSSFACFHCLIRLSLVLAFQSFWAFRVHKKCLSNLYAFLSLPHTPTIAYPSAHRTYFPAPKDEAYTISLHFQPLLIQLLFLGS